jgi:choline-sulfatase
MAETNNILLIMNEDHGQWALGCYGNREIRSPAIDYLARTGVLMENAFTPNPVCSPSRACLLTGRLPSQHGVHDYISTTLSPAHQYPWLKDEITLSELLARSGYQTGLIGKWHLGRDETPQAGFDTWFTHSFDYPIGHGGQHRYSDQGRIIQLSGYKTQIITDHAVNFLRQRDPQKPFFLFVSYTASHSPWDNHPERLVMEYRRGTFEDIPDDSAYPFGKQNLESAFASRDRPREALAQYYASVSQVDEGVGRLMDEIEALGLRESTLIIFLSDHGLNCSHHGIWGKGNGTLPLNMVEESIRIPLIFNQPGRLFSRQKRVEPVDHCDTFQTLLEYAGVSPPVMDKGYYPGRSYLPMLVNSSPLQDWRTVQFGEYGNLRMMRTQTHKLVRRYPQGPCELFDLKADPRETTNLFYEPVYQTLVNQMTAQINAYFAHYEDPAKSGLLAANLPIHNTTEAWRNESDH